MLANLGPGWAWCRLSPLSLLRKWGVFRGRAWNLGVGGRLPHGRVLLSLPCVDTGLGRMPSRDELDSVRLRTSGGETRSVGGDPRRVVETGPEAPGESAPTTSVPTKSRDGEPSGKREKARPFVLGEGIPPVPARLVSRIWDDDYIDMAELLRDNLEAERRGNSGNTQQSGLPGGSHSKPLRREVPDVLSWAQCFGVYIGVVVEKYPDRVKQLLAYQATVLREARRCGGSGWRSYDAMFRQLAAADPSTDWSRLNPSLYATTFLVQQSSGRRICTLCMGADHAPEECALAPLQAKLPRPQTREREDERKEKVGTPGGVAPRDGRMRRRSDQPCYLWNEGRCNYPYCRYRHVCLRCRGDHRATGCSVPPPPGVSLSRNPPPPWGRGQGQI